MKRVFLLLALALAIFAVAEGATTAAPKKAKPNEDEVTTAATMGKEYGGSTVNGTEEPPKPKYFTEKWKSRFSEKQLELQAKWMLAEKQPEDGTFQTRIYPTQWWSKSFTPCVNQIKATSSGYLNLYFFFNGFNYQRRYYSLTYPVMQHIDKRPKPTPAPKAKTTTKNPPTKNGKKKRRRRRKPKKICATKFTTQFYLPLPLDKWAPKTQDKTISSFKAPEETYYVREYYSNYTSAYCNEQAKGLFLDLLKNNIWTWEDYWICAKYEPPAGTTEQVFEVWMKERLVE